MIDDNILLKLAEDFPKSQVSWRLNSKTAIKGNSGETYSLALAYIDARDVMDRLDTVVGASSWQDKYMIESGRTICSIGILVNGTWVWKTDGCGDTDVEADKGAMSDAFKRAAVKWGIGRYLYDIKKVYVPCDCDENGKVKWMRKGINPWDYVKTK